MSANAKMRMAGTKRPKTEYNSGLLEFRQARHHISENMTAKIMMKVPTPIPKIRVEVVVCELAVYKSMRRVRIIFSI